RQFQRPFALLLVRAAKVRSGEPAPPGGPIPSWIEAMRSHLRSVDRIALYGLDAVQVLLSETGADEVARIALAIATPAPSSSARLLVGVVVRFDVVGSVDELIERSREAAYRAVPERPVEFAPQQPFSL